MSEIQRYDMILGTKCGEGWQELEPAEDGEWMRFEDHQRELERLRRLLSRLTGSAEYALKVGYKADDCGDHCSNGCYWCDLRREAETARTELKRTDAELHT
jgi:hypothetical protein